VRARSVAAARFVSLYGRYGFSEVR